MKKEWLVLIFIIAIASFFRLYHINIAPPGLYPDEAVNGNNALQAIRNHDFKVFYTDNNGREGLFINLQAISLSVFGIHPWSLRIVSALAGVLTVLGLYLLAKQMFNWQIAAMSSFLMAVSFWHVLFSRIGFRAIMAPLFTVFAFYFLFKGLAQPKYRYFIYSGIFWGLGFYTYIAFRIMPLALILIILAYWLSIKKNFEYEKYEHAKTHLVKSLVLLLISTIIISLPLGVYFLFHQQDFLGRLGQVSVLNDKNIVSSTILNGLKTLGMFNFFGDQNWRHNLSGSPELFWPVGILFLIGIFRSVLKLFASYKRHGHFSIQPVLVLSWFLVGLLPAILSSEGIPHALRIILVAPAVFIFAGEGLWWAYKKVSDYYELRDVHEIMVGRRKIKESSMAALLFVIFFLAAVSVYDFNKYFNVWAKNSNTIAAYNQNYVDIGNKLNLMPDNIKKYVLVNASGVLVNGIPMPAQTVMFITDTASPKKQKVRNLFYLTPKQFEKGEYDRRSIVIPLEK